MYDKTCMINMHGILCVACLHAYTCMYACIHTYIHYYFIIFFIKIFKKIIIFLNIFKKKLFFFKVFFSKKWRVIMGWVLSRGQIYHRALGHGHPLVYIYNKIFLKKVIHKKRRLARGGGIKIGIWNLMAISQLLWMFRRMILESDWI